MARRALLITYIATYLLAFGGIVRTLVRFGEDHPWSIGILVGVYLILLFAEPFLIRRNRLLTYSYLFIQVIIICTLAYITPNVDYWALLFCPLILQVMHNFPHRSGFLLTGVITLIMSVFFILGLGLDIALPLILIYGMVFFLFASLLAIVREVEAAREESQKQQAELQSAHQQLQTYTKQAEQLAVLQERNRLARELHDSVSQSLYSLTLFSEAARHMAEDIGEQKIEQYIGQIGVIGQQALKEMRLLIYELQPPELEREGLVRALRKRLEAVEGRAGVETRLEVDNFGKVPGDMEGELYRIAQEALNNSLKHGGASSVVVYLHQSNGNIEMEIVDDGVGFIPNALPDQGGMGLKSIRDRAEQIGGTATIHSLPGVGTSVKVNLQRISVSNDESEASPIP